MQQPNDQQTQLQRFYRKELEEIAQTRDTLRAKYRPNESGSDGSSDGDLDDDHDHRYDSGIKAADMQTHIPETNIGYRLLLKMGWKAGTGLGQNAAGRTVPIPIEVKQDVLGLGKQEVDTWYNESTTLKRKATELEKQAEETEDERIKRENQVEQQKAIKAELNMVKSAFYCALCDKQYERISEYEVHLSSYDHNHKKRFKEMKDTSRAGAANVTNKIKEKERKREERELAKLQEAAMKKTGGTVGNSTQTQQPGTSSGLGSIQSVKTTTFQSAVATDSSTGTGASTKPVSDATQGVGGFQPVKMTGFQPVKLGGFQTVKISGFQPVEDEDDAPTQATTTTPSTQASASEAAPAPSGFQPVKIGGFKPMKIGGFQLKKPGAK